VLALLDLVLPASCASCGRPGELLCSGCAQPLLATPRIAWPRPTPRGLPPPYVVTDYDGSARDALLGYKERGAVGLSHPLGWALARAVAEAVLPLEVTTPVWLVPVPSRPSARRERGDDVVARLARVAAGALRRDGRHARVLRALRHVRRVADSAGLGAGERARNLQGAIGVRPGLADALATRPAIVVDDLITTGATMAECSGALRAAGAQVRAVAAVAATVRR
jgi:predicted amidophosphoribosyltransferase